MIHAVLGTGPCPEKALIEALRDALGDDDEIIVPWVWPIPSSLESVYAYILDHEIPFTLVYNDDTGKVPTKHFREADFGTVLKSRDPIDRCIADCDNSVLYLWDENEDFIERIFKQLPDVTVRELSNGLTPIIVELDETAPPSPPQEVQETQEAQEEPDDGPKFSREELEIMAATAVKRYGERLGCLATTKTGIIEELFPSESGSTPTAIIVLYDDGTWKKLND